MKLSDFITYDKGFQVSVNIAFDFSSKDKIASLIPTDSVCRYVEEIVKDVIVQSPKRAKLLVGPYGTGKSHITLAALSSMWFKERDSYARLVAAYRNQGLEFADTFEHFAADGPKLLPVIISGSSADLQHSLLYSLRNALRFAGLEALMPSTNYEGAIEVINRWQSLYPDTLQKLEDLSGLTAESIKSKLGNMDTSVYQLFIDLYPLLTSGSAFDSLENASVIDIYEKVLASLKTKGISGIYVVYDEFSKYLESNIETASVEDTKLLQDFAEKCNRSGSDQQLHLLLISHKSLSNYIDSKLPKDKVDGWRGVSGRFVELEIRNNSNQSYELISNAIVKDKSSWTKWLKADNCAIESRIEKAKKRYVGSGLLTKDNEDLVAYGAYPLHPLTAFLLPELSGKIAQNERTLFTFLCSPEKNSLVPVLANEAFFIGPDAVYDYFEPLMKREYYTSSVHKTYELAEIALRKLDQNTLESRIVKMLALIEIVARYEAVEPTRQTIRDVYTDCGYSESELDAALERLAETDSVVYLRQSDSFFKLKESSGVRVDMEVEDRADALRSKMTPCEILNRRCRTKALYPSQYNDNNDIVRYFSCGFASFSDLNGLREGIKPKGLADGDGYVAAVYIESPDQMKDLDDLAERLSSAKMSVYVAPRQYVDISEALYKLEAAAELKLAAINDSVLAEEYEIIIEDYEEIVNSFIDGYFSPEKNASKYFIDGRRKNKVVRRRRLSDMMSELCEKAFPHTPRITSEALNKNQPTGTALHSRAKILVGLCAQNLEPSLGFVGNGQETSMMRSALENTGLIEKIEDAPKVNIGHASTEADYVMDVIEQFIASADHSSFAVLYSALTELEGGIGMRRGPVPLFIALALRKHRDALLITKEGEERTFSAETLEDIDSDPAAFELSLLNWNQEMADFARALGGLFGCAATISKADVVEALRRWYVKLPQLVRIAKEDHSGLGLSKSQLKIHQAFLQCLRNQSLSSDELLFSKLPSIFGLDINDAALIRAIRDEKEFCDDYATLVHEELAKEIKSLTAPHAPVEASLDSSLRDWIEGLGSVGAKRVFSGANNAIISAIKGSTPDEKTTVARIAKAATSLRIEDWNDARFGDFKALLSAAIAEAENCKEKNDGKSSGNLAISFMGSTGDIEERTFESVEYSSRARMLKRSIEACMSEMGGAVNPEEKRQVVFDVLKELCK